MAYSDEELRRVAEAVRATDGSTQAASEHLGMPWSSTDRRIKAAIERGILPPREAKRGKPGNPTIEMSETEARAVLAAYKAYRCSPTHTGAALGVTLDTMKRMVKRAERVVGALTEDEIVQAKSEGSLDTDLRLRRARTEASSAKSKLADASEEIFRLQMKLADLESVVRSDATPAEWTLRPRQGSTTDHIPMLFTSDFQIGEVIREEETEHGYGYSTEIFRRRYRAMIETTLQLCFKHASKDWTYPGIVYARGGDTVSGAIHDELAETDDVTPIRAVEIAFEEEAAGIAKLADAFGRVDVKDCGGGNHDRVTKKPRSKQAWSNLDRLVSFMLQREFAQDPRVHFQTTESMDVFFPIYQRNYLLTHGDRIGSRGGQGFVGPAATIMRGAQKVLQEQAALGRRVDCVMMGHFHTPLWYDWVLVNGSLPGYSEFAKMNRMRPHAPQQWLVMHHERHGVVDLKPIILT